MNRRLLASLALGLAMAGTSALTGALTPGVRLAQGQVPFQLESMIPQRFGTWQLDPGVVPLTPDPEQQGMLKKLYDQTLSRTYIDGAGRRVMLSIAYGGDQSKALQLHLPEVCYVAQGFQLLRDGAGSLATPYGTLPVKRLVARQGQRNEPITYWITIGDKATRSGIEQKLRRLAYGLSGEIPDGMLVRVSSIALDEPAAYALQDRFVAQLLASLDAPGRARLIGAQASASGAGQPGGRNGHRDVARAAQTARHSAWEGDRSGDQGSEQWDKQVSKQVSTQVSTQVSKQGDDQGREQATHHLAEQAAQ